MDKLQEKWIQTSAMVKTSSSVMPPTVFFSRFRTILEDHHVNRHQGDFMSHMVDLQETKQDQFQ